jgi:phosphoserine aminotransferase
MLREKTKANYFTTGAWSEAAIKEAKKYCNAVEVWPDSGSKFTTIPDVSKWNID